LEKDHRILARHCIEWEDVNEILGQASLVQGICAGCLIGKPTSLSRRSLTHVFTLCLRFFSHEQAFISFLLNQIKSCYNYLCHQPPNPVVYPPLGCVF